MADPLLRRLVATAFDGELPPLVDALVPWASADDHAQAFPAGPVLRLGDPRPGRAYVADVVEGPAFRARLADLVPDPAVRRFLAEAPAARTVVDTDGHAGTVFVDDLHQLPELAPAWHPPHEAPPLGAGVRWPGGERTTLSRHGPPPRALLSPSWQRRLDDLLHAGLVGIWCVRWAGDRVAGLVWVNDARWRGDAEEAAARIDARGDARWAACRSLAAGAGLLAYPDAVEVLPDGTWEVTVGLVDPARKDPGLAPGHQTGDSTGEPHPPQGARRV